MKSVMLLTGAGQISMAIALGIIVIPLAIDEFNDPPEEGKPAVSLTPGTVITIPAGVKHWHGAKADNWFSHIAVEIPGEECSNEWLEPVDDEAYGKL